MSEWQPIDTAPKDSDEILAYADGEMFVAWWHAPDEEFVWSLPQRSLDSDGCYISPTHWMPLPEPPA